MSTTKFCKNDSTLIPTPEELHRMIKSCGPTLKICSEEKYLPTSVEHFVESSVLVDDENGNFAHSLTIDNLPKGKESRKYALVLKNPSAFNADFPSAKAYVTAEAVNNKYTDLRFWFFHALRPAVRAKITNVTASKRPIELPLLSEKEGHWELVTLRFDNADRAQPLSAGVGTSGVDSWLPFSECDKLGNHLLVYSSFGEGISLSSSSPAPHLQAKTYKNVIGDHIRVDLSNRTDAPADSKNLDCSIDYEILNAREPKWVNFEGKFGWGSYPCSATPRELRVAVQRYSNPWPEFLPRMVHPYDGRSKQLKQLCQFDRITFKSVADDLHELFNDEEEDIRPSPGEGLAMSTKTEVYV